jgi:hypothetical protein
VIGNEELPLPNRESRLQQGRNAYWMKYREKRG